MNFSIKGTSKKIALVSLATTFFLCALLSAAFIVYKMHAFYVAKNTVAPVIPSQYIAVTVDGNSLSVDASQPEKWYDVPMLTTEQDTKVTLGTFQGYTITVDGKSAAPNSTVAIRLKTLTKEEPITLTLKNQATGTESKYYIRTKNGAVPDFSTLGTGIGKGFYYSALGNFIFKMDFKGNLVFYKQVNNPYDFKMTKVDGKIRYSYLEAVENSQNPAKSPGMLYNQAIVMDQNYNVIDRVPYLIPNGDIPANYSLDDHDFMILGDKHYIIASAVGKRVTNIPADVPHSAFGARVTAAVLQEIDHGKLVWQWDSTEHPELYGMSVESNDYFNMAIQWSDYMHFNSMTVDPSDQNLICSFRHLSSVLKIDRKTGKILWVLGGKDDQFGLTQGQKFSQQHFVRLTENGDLTIFDNGCNSVATGYPAKYEGAGKGVSRILKMKLDQKNKKLLSFSAFTQDQQYSLIMGSATEIGPDSNIFMVGWGGRLTPNASFSLIDFSKKKVLFEAVYPFDSKIWSDDTYRAYWFEQ